MLLNITDSPKFHDNPRPSFNCEELLGWMDTLPSGPKWNSIVLEVEGYKTTDPIHLIWRDAGEVAVSLFGDPIFGADMMFDPLLVMNEFGREYSEWFSAHKAHRIQVCAVLCPHEYSKVIFIQDCLPEGATIVPILAASDKTPVTRMTGGLEMHPLFISIGNILGHICMAATSHAWRCVAFMPIPKFDVPSTCQSILQHRLWHRCADIVMDGLTCAMANRHIMVEPHRFWHNCFMPLATWTGDLPEQLMIACVAKNASPVMEVTHKLFGDASCHPSRTGEHILECIDNIAHMVDPWNLVRFQKQAKAIQLSSIYLLCWRNWLHAEPSIFLIPEILHFCHKLFFDHVLKWCKEVVGEELDARFKCHHKRIVARHFKDGVSHVKQMMGREHRDIQCTIIAMIAGHVPPRFLRTICALINFIYQAQSPVHTDSSVNQMELSLREFHAHKDAIIEAGAR